MEPAVVKDWALAETASSAYFICVSGIASALF